MTATDANGCKGTATSTVTVSGAFVASVNSPTICAGTSATLTATGGASYKWSNNATTASITVNPTATTNYNVTVTNAAGCSKTLTATVTVSGALVASVNSPIICAGHKCNFNSIGWYKLQME